MTKKDGVIVYCKTCGSQGVVRDATAQWSNEDQKWELVDVTDAAWCRDCGGEATLAEAPIYPTEGA